jgi:hypothetical protein
MQASAAPPRMYWPRLRFGYASELLLAGVVVIVSVAVPTPELGTVTGLAEPKLKVGVPCAPVGLPVITAVKATLPVKPPAGVTVTVDVFPVLAPGATLTAVPLTVKLGAAAVTVTTTGEEVEAAKLVSPRYPVVID